MTDDIDGCTSLVCGSARTLKRNSSVAVARYTENGQRVAQTTNTQIVPMLHLAHLVGISAHCHGCATRFPANLHTKIRQKRVSQ